MTASIRTELERAIGEIASDRHENQVDRDAVAKELANSILVEHLDMDEIVSDAVDVGVETAIEETDEDTFSAAVDQLRDHIHVQLSEQAKSLAIKILRDTAKARIEHRVEV